MNVIRRGNGKPLLLLHGLGGSYRSWDTIADALAGQRRLVIPDLPGFGSSAPLPGKVSIATLADSVTRLIADLDLGRVDAVGSSMGARLALELARRGVVGNVVSLDPGGFWEGWEKPVFYASVAASIRLVRALQPAMPLFTNNPVLRSVLFAQFSAHPWTIPGRVALTEMRTFARAASFDELLRDLVYGEKQQGAATTPGRLAIGWGRRDLVCFPPQAARAAAAFPSAELHWFENSGHFPHWDMPAETVQLILETTN